MEWNWLTLVWVFIVSGMLGVIGYTVGALITRALLWVVRWLG